MRGDLEKLGSAVLAQGQLGRDTAGLIAETIPRLADIDDRLAHAEEQVAQLLAEPKSSRNPAPVHWPTLPAAEAEARWIELAEWVATILVDWLDLTRGQIPDCWPRHRPAVLELSWLRSSYLQAYLPTSPPTLAAEWHARWRRDALANIATAIPTEWCRPGEHLIHELDMRSRSKHADRSSPGVSFASTEDPGHPSEGNYRRPTREHERAERRHWWPHLQQAIAEDLDHRHRPADTQSQPSAHA